MKKPKEVIAHCKYLLWTSRKLIAISMSHSILVTGASGYLGGSLLAQLARAKLPQYHKLYALVRTPAQAEAIKQYGAEPMFLNLEHEESLVKSIIDAKITIVYFLIDARTSDAQIPMIKALGEVKKQTGKEVHFLHTTGAKIFSQHVGFPTDRTVLDTDPGLYELQKTSKPPYSAMAQVCFIYLTSNFHTNSPIFPICSN
jgi:hypothetical protein